LPRWSHLKDPFEQSTWEEQAGVPDGSVPASFYWKTRYYEHLARRETREGLNNWDVVDQATQPQIFQQRQ
jgi:hypothetical protein